MDVKQNTTISFGKKERKKERKEEKSPDGGLLSALSKLNGARIISAAAESEINYISLFFPCTFI